LHAHFSRSHLNVTALGISLPVFTPPRSTSDNSRPCAPVAPDLLTSLGCQSPCGGSQLLDPPMEGPWTAPGQPVCCLMTSESFGRHDNSRHRRGRFPGARIVTPVPARAGSVAHSRSEGVWPVLHEGRVLLEEGWAYST